MALAQRLCDRIELYRGKARVFDETTVSVADGRGRIPFYRLVEGITQPSAVIRVVIAGDNGGDNKFHVHPVVHLDIDISPERGFSKPLVENYTVRSAIPAGKIVPYVAPPAAQAYPLARHRGARTEGR